jgi:hypothetical protein
MNHQQDVIRTLVDYYQAFSTLEVHAIAPYFHEPALLVAPQGAFSAPTHEALRTALTTLVDSLRARGFGRSELRVDRVDLLSASTALVTGVAVRYTVGGPELERVGVTYVLQNADPRPKIAVLIVHDPDAIAPPT